MQCPADDDSDRAQTPAIPWFVWCTVVAVTSAMVGGHWDISWHRSIGRDAFWTAPHIAIYLCGVLAGVSSAYLILSTTFGRDRALRAGVGVDVGLSRTARRLHRRLGRRGHADLGAVR